MSGTFDWIRNIGKNFSEPSVPQPGEAERAVSAADMLRLGWISPSQAENVEWAMEDLKSIIKKSAWKLAPQFGRDAIRFIAPDGKIPFVITFRGGETGFFICIQGLEDPLALAEIPREFTESIKTGYFMGILLNSRSQSLRRYVSAIGNSVKYGSC